ncbi:unnamed protein product [Parnassius apollo]|uniref:(apollo) hypothetical protein n=1 Tax=Parnassius apollo TaxID=110799 RepID=A0A8S3Y606_PARAO|nr:unnamed protein product [Parnassius apollo]
MWASSQNSAKIVLRCVCVGVGAQVNVSQSASGAPADRDPLTQHAAKFRTGMCVVRFKGQAMVRGGMLGQ